MKSDNVLASLRSVLEQEHAALLAGRLADLEQLAAQKEGLFHQLSHAAMPAAVMAETSEMIARNQRLLQAAIKGVETTQQALSTYADIKKGSVVYASDGSVSRLSGGGKGVSRKV